jgi:AcrR family transcriptional regulator
MVRERLGPEERKSQMIQAAFDIAIKDGFHKITRGGVAGRCSCATSLVTHYFGSTEALAEKVMEKALLEQVWPVVASGIVLDHPVTRSLSPELRQQALRKGVSK